MSDSFKDIGDRLKAYRLGRDIPPEALAEKIGVSRAALYRYEKGIPPKLETLEKIAQVLDVSLPSLLGVGVEYIASSVSFFERMRQIEMEAKHISVLFGPISYLLTSKEFDEYLPEVLIEGLPADIDNHDQCLEDIEKIVEILKERKRNYEKQKPSILCLVSASELQRFVYHGFVGRNGLPPKLQKQRIEVAKHEIEYIIKALENPPIGIQIGVLSDTMPNSAFQIFRQPDRDIVAISPFKLGDLPNTRIGVGLITSSPEAVKLHTEITETLWSRSLKGQAAIDYIKRNILDSKISSS